MKSNLYSRVGVLLLLLASIGSAHAEQVTVAVAANFTAAMQRLTPEFERTSGHKLVSSFGATGKLYAQISNGAPFDVLLAADDATPAKLETEGFAVGGTRFTYAIGRLVLWSPQSGVVDENGAILKSGNFTHLAIANPKTAPYGAAAEQAMRRLGVWDRLVPRLVYGEHIAQTLQFIHSGNAQLGFVALAQVRALPPDQSGSQWLVPETLHEPLRQDAVLLKRAADKPAARAFLDYLRSAKARVIIEDLGYANGQ
ncbi:MAG TPA: molybdate ABC transporter substrate-binding protein [Burkholderiaceae bacterium]|nr:molybdate ABC transporter substrate-binding protein [Burkholderiaceae bacterium]